jgi:hypothetical protein
MRWSLAIALVLLLAGCAAPASPAPDPAARPTTAPSAPTFDLGIHVAEERPDGNPVAGAVVQLALVDERDAVIGTPWTRSTDASGWLRLSWPQPVRVAIQVSAPDKASWTIEGARLNVGEQITPQWPVVLSDRDVFLPLYRTQLNFELGHAWSTTTVQPTPSGEIGKVHTQANLEFPQASETGYLQRLDKAFVRLSWEETVTDKAELATGLAWNGKLWVQGDSAGPGVLPGARQATYEGPLPAQNRPEDLTSATLQVAAITSSAVVGDLPLKFNVQLQFSDRRPSELPDPRCHAADGCIIPLPASRN